MERESRRGIDDGARSTEGALICALLGRPGAGKGTQGAILASQFDLVHVSTGELARAVPVSDQRYADVALRVRSGQLIPDETIFDLIVEQLALHPTGRGILFDGYPRNLKQAMMLDELVPIDVVIHLDVLMAVAQQRLTRRRRGDDRDETVAARLRRYEEESSVVLDRYCSLGLLRRIDGDRPPELVAADVLAAIRHHPRSAPRAPTMPNDHSPRPTDQEFPHE